MAGGATKPLLELEDEDELLLEELEDELLDDELVEALDDELLVLLDDEPLDDEPPACPPHALKMMASAAAPKILINFIRGYPIDFYCY